MPPLANTQMLATHTSMQRFLSRQPLKSCNKLTLVNRQTNNAMICFEPTLLDSLIHSRTESRSGTESLFLLFPGQDNFCPWILAGGRKSWPGCLFWDLRTFLSNFWGFIHFFCRIFGDLRTFWLNFVATDVYALLLKSLPRLFFPS